MNDQNPSGRANDERGTMPRGIPNQLTGASAGLPSRYGQLWRSVPRELGFLLLAMPVALAGFIAVITLFTTGAGLLVTFVGIFVIVVALYVARGFGSLELLRLRWAGRPAIERPEWQDARARQGFWGWLRALFGNGHYWLYLLHTGLINFAVSLFSWIVTVVWTSIALAGTTYWFWQIFLPRDGSNRGLADLLLERYGIDPASVNLTAIEIVLYLVLGVIFAVLLPFVTRGLVLIHEGIARGLLGAFASDALQREVIALSASRGAAQAAEGHSLRRLERDIHDGPQQRLVRLQMDLAAADRQLDADPAKARELLTEAMQQSRDALEELRALSRGFAPPILMDRGLVAALESVAIRSAVPAQVSSDLPTGTLIPQEIERNAYFVASEAMMNAAQHGGASQIQVLVQRVPMTDRDAAWLQVTVTDNGSGGAAAVPGHGLAGLDERLRGLGGRLDLSSPTGGPTVVTAWLPLL